MLVLSRPPRTALVALLPCQKVYLHCSIEGGDIDQSEVHRNARRNLDYWFNPSIAHRYYRSSTAVFAASIKIRGLPVDSLNPPSSALLPEMKCRSTLRPSRRP